MNNTYQAKNGFKTFLLTLVISLSVFGVVYYVTSYPSYRIDIDSHTGGSPEEVEVLSDSSSATSPFAQLTKEEVSTPKRVVLAGSTVSSGTSPQETTQSTVPDTGVISMTISLFISLVILFAGVYYIYLGPHKLALKSFENKILE